MAGIKDVAKRAGVSISTVSYVLSGKRSVSKETKQKVLRAARDLQYSPNAGARMLRGDRTHIIALSAPMYETTDYTNYSVFFLKTAQRARLYHYDVLLLAGDDEEQDLSRIVESGLVDGVVMLDVNLRDSRVDLARNTAIPFVSIGDPGDTDSVNAVDTDFARMGRQAVDRLADAGHTKILFVGGKKLDYERESNFLVRLRDGLFAEATRRGVEVVMTYQPDGDMAGIQREMETEFTKNPDITAVVSQASLVQLGNLTTALMRMGLRIPEDISVISVGVGGDASTLSTPVDAMPLLPELVCQRGVDIMMDVLAGKQQRSGTLELTAPKYFDRGSVAAPRKGDVRVPRV
ncbi:MAG: LacI family transcriptional regulator [Bifidobacteriaceae bacterium]|jgi:DNA-binding LacI/PurR family transcriptional regulator|nr:LacI family transcriptional regulator [Bifidobacteriaceae bacterium]